MKDSELIELFLRHEKRAIDELMCHYGPLMRYIIAPILPDERDREECLSDVLMQIWNKIEQFDSGKGSFNGWLTALVRNMALNRARSNSSIAKADEIQKDIIINCPSPEEILIQKEQAENLAQAISRLTTAEKALFYRKYYYMQSTAQIAAELCISERAVEGRLYRIKQKLRRIIGGGKHD